MKSKNAFYQRGEVATLLTIAAMIVVGVSVFISSIATNQNRTTTSTRASAVVCTDTPDIPPPDTAPNPRATTNTPGYFWEADCHNTKGFLNEPIRSQRSYCISSSECGRNTTQGEVNPATSNFCYTWFGDGNQSTVQDNRCMMMKWGTVGQPPTPVVNTPTPVPPTAPPATPTTASNCFDGLNNRRNPGESYCKQNNYYYCQPNGQERLQQNCVSQNATCGINQNGSVACIPNATATPRPTNTPVPRATNTPVPAPPGPTNTPVPVATNTPVPAPTVPVCDSRSNTGCPNGWYCNGAFIYSTSRYCTQNPPPTPTTYVDPNPTRPATPTPTTDPCYPGGVCPITRPPATGVPSPTPTRPAAAATYTPPNYTPPPPTPVPTGPVRVQINITGSTIRCRQLYSPSRTRKVGVNVYQNESNLILNVAPEVTYDTYYDYRGTVTVYHTIPWSAVNQGAQYKYVPYIVIDIDGDFSTADYRRPLGAAVFKNWGQLHSTRRVDLQVSYTCT